MIKSRLVAKLALTLVVATASLLTFIAPANAAPNGSTHVGPFAGGSQDGSSCGGVWANDTYTLTFNVKNNGNGTYDLRTEYKNGTFETLGGASPGSCSTSNHHGTTVAAGVKGDFQGYVTETVTSASFNPAACATPGVCTTRGTAVAAMFSATNESDFRWNFEYNSKDKSLGIRHWQDKSSPDGSSDVFEGDISN